MIYSKTELSCCTLDNCQYPEPDSIALENMKTAVSIYRCMHISTHKMCYQTVILPWSQVIVPEKKKEQTKPFCFTVGNHSTKKKHWLQL